MTLIEALRVIYDQSTALPGLKKVTRQAYDDLRADRRVPYSTLKWIVREAGLMNILDGIKEVYGANAAKEIILAFERELGPGPVS
jgi:hypothetical protein